MRHDPWLVQRLIAEARFRRGEAAVYRGLIAAMTIWLDTARALVLHRPIPQAALDLLADPAPVTAAGDRTPDIDAARAATQVWTRAVSEHVDPALREAFGDAFLDASRRADISPLPFQLAYLEQVHDRLKIWPEGAFEELRPELLEMLSEGMSYDEIEERIGRILDIDAPTRRIRAEISEIDRQLKDPTLSKAEKAALRARKRELWTQHDESLKEWQWKARRIARTEIHGATEGGAYAAALAVEEAGGEARYKRWLATTDERVRGSHAVADGQICRLREPFTVGQAELMHPGQAGAPGHEVINCRCTALYMTQSEVDAELERTGGRGVSPGGARIGPDDPGEVEEAIDRWKAIRRGESVDDDTGPLDDDQTDDLDDDAGDDTEQQDDLPGDEDDEQPPDDNDDDADNGDDDADNGDDDADNGDDDADDGDDNDDDAGDEDPDDDDRDPDQDPDEDTEDEDEDTDTDGLDDDQTDDDPERDDPDDDSLDDDDSDDDGGDADDGEDGDSLDDFFRELDEAVKDDEPDTDDDDTDDEIEDDPQPILDAETLAILAALRRQLPRGADEWNALTDGEIIRPAETFGERRIWELEQKLEQLRSDVAALARDERVAEFADRPGEDDPQVLRELDDRRVDELNRRRRLEEDLIGKLSRARSERSIARWRRELDACREGRRLLERYMNLRQREVNERRALQDLREHPPNPSALWNQSVAELRSSGYRDDGDGGLLPPQALDAHLDAVLAAGKVVRTAIQARLDSDARLQRLIARRAARMEKNDWRAVDELRRQIAAREAEVVRAGLAEAREFGGHQQRARLAQSPHYGWQTQPGDARTLDDLRNAEQFFPYDWLRRADARGELVLARSERAFFLAHGQDRQDLIAGRMSKVDDFTYDGAFDYSAQEVMVHEMGHRMEQAVPGLTHLEFAFVRRRALGPDGKLEKRRQIYAGTEEWALFDRWRHPYAGKVYDWTRHPARAAHEVFQVGLQDLFGRSSDRYGDEELIEFMMAVMLAL
ncbi:phage minor head protein [Nocardia farcinica]